MAKKIDQEEEFDIDEIMADVFDDYEPDANRRYIISKDGKYSLSKEKNGNPIAQKWYDSISETENFGHPTYVVCSNNCYSIVDVNLTPLFDFHLPKYDYYEIIYSNINQLIPKYICVKKDGKYGLLNMNGDLIVDFIFDEIITPASYEAWSQGQLYDDTLAVLFINKDKENQKVGFLLEYEIIKGQEYEIVDKYIEPLFDSWESRIVVFDIDDLEVVLKGKKGYLDINGNFTQDCYKAYIGIESAIGHDPKRPLPERLVYLYKKESSVTSIRQFLKKHESTSWFDIFDEERYCQRKKSRTYERPYNGSYAKDVMGYSDDDIDTIFDGDPDAYWNID